MAKLTTCHRILRFDSLETVSSDDSYSGDSAINISSDTVFGFLDESSDGSPETESINRNIHEDEVEEEDDDEKENSGNVEDCHFWENQNQQLQGVLCRTTSVESRIRKITKETLREAQQGADVCSCHRAFNNGCRECLMKELCSRLQKEGFNSAICKSKWKSSPEIPSGEHTFMDVLDNSNSKKGNMRIIIELNFRGEFEMARASEEYNRLIKNLPEVFVGKVERLLSVVKILCTAAKKCMKEKKIHIAPWRKQKYMQAKWLRNCERKTSPPPLSSTVYSTEARRRPRASMLTVDLMEISNLHLAAVEVV